MNKVFKNLKYENKVFYTFLIMHLIVWTAVAMIRTIMPTDALEGVYWGSLMDFGTNKHPPLAGWLSYLVWIPFKIDFFLYLFAQLVIVGGFVYVYKLAKCFLDENRAILSVIILEGCWCYSYIVPYYGFNPDVILLLMLPMIAYHFYQCITNDKSINWIVLGVIIGISFLNKYQTAFLLAPMLVWAIMFKRDIFKNKWFYFSVILAFLIFLPHLLWLIKYDFFPLLYFEGELTSKTWFDHIKAPLMFLLMQVSLIIGSILIFVACRLKYKTPFKVIENYNKKDFWFIILLGLLPIALHLFMGFSAGGTMRPRWGYEFWFMCGIMLFYFFPSEINKKQFDFMVKGAYTVMFIIFLAMSILLSVEKNFRNRYPVSTVMQDLTAIWAEKYDTPLKYVGGYIEYSMPLTVYDKSHPINLMDTNRYKSPWIDEDDLKKSGAMIIDRYDFGVKYYTEKTIPYLPKDFEIKPLLYKFTVRNAFNMPREYTVNYFIVPPM